MQLGSIQSQETGDLTITTVRDLLVLGGSEQISHIGGAELKNIPGEPNGDYLMSIGPGLRYTWDPYVTAKLDWEIKLHHQDFFTGGWSMVQFNAIVSY